MGGRWRRRVPDDDVRAGTIVQENIDIKIAIINNGYLGMVRQWQEFFYECLRSHALVESEFCEVGGSLRYLAA